MLLASYVAWASAKAAHIAFAAPVVRTGGNPCFRVTAIEHDVRQRGAFRDPMLGRAVVYPAALASTKRARA